VLRSVVDPHHLDRDPDADLNWTYYPDADTDSDFLFDADPDPDLSFKKTGSTP
jgi:hypothetical protein